MKALEDVLDRMRTAIATVRLVGDFNFTQHQTWAFLLSPHRGDDGTICTLSSDRARVPSEIKERVVEEITPVFFGPDSVVRIVGYSSASTPMFLPTPELYEEMKSYIYQTDDEGNDLEEPLPVASFMNRPASMVRYLGFFSKLIC